MTDNVATLVGFSRQVVLDNGQGASLFVLVHPLEDLDGLFKAWDMDAQEWIVVNGWLWTVEA